MQQWLHQPVVGNETSKQLIHYYERINKCIKILFLQIKLVYHEITAKRHFVTELGDQLKILTNIVT